MKCNGGECRLPIRVLQPGSATGQSAGARVQVSRVPSDITRTTSPSERRF
jgi:hypothetical protein